MDQTQTPSANSKLDAILAAYLEEVDRGETPERAKLIAANPDLAVELQAFFADLDRVQRAAAPQIGPEGISTIIGQGHSAPGSNDGGHKQADKSSSDGQRFRFLRPHAKGGLGEVSVAQDTELNREVALKEIQSQYADHPDSRSRFVLEAEITGGLEHPGIVPVYGLGQYANGRPYYAMRFIRGDSLKEAIGKFYQADVPGRDPGERTLELRRLLGRFIDVCQAMEYAHSRGVLHRDLKPGNIMLGKYGETLVVDWGLAKAAGKTAHFAASPETTLEPSSGSAVERTEMGAAIGTPAYMSPEQAAGRLDLLGPATDVYSLGATLYHLLTGQSPFANRPMPDLLARVKKGEFPRPSELQSQVPKPLEAVCLKAMSLHCEDRYQTAAQIAEEIEHWLADEPVACYREPFAVRARRWVKRHPALVVGTAATVLFSLVSMAVIASVVGESNRTLAAKNSDLQQSILREQKATAKAEAAAKAERHAKGLETVARQRSQEAEALTLTSFQESTDDVIEQLIGSKPELGPQERDYLERTLKRWQAFADRQENDELGQMYRAEGHTRVGKIWSKLGKREEAQKAYEQARDDCLALASAFPHNRRYQFGLASSLNGIGNLLNDSMIPTDDDLRASYVASKQARDILRKLVVQFPDDADYQLELANSHANLGASEGLGMERVIQVRTEYVRSRHVLELLANASPKNPVYQQELASNHLRMGGLHSFEFDNQPAELAEYKQAREIQERLVEQHPAVIEYRIQLARILKQHGNSLCKKRFGTLASSTLGIPDAQIANRFGAPRQTADAQECFVQAIAIQQGFVDQFPSIPIYRRNLGTSYSSLAVFLRDRGDFSEAYIKSRKAVEHYEKLSQIVPNGSADSYVLLFYRGEMARIAYASGDIDAALSESEKTAATLRLLAKEKPLDVGPSIVMNGCLYLMNAIHFQRRQYAESAVVMDEFATICPPAQHTVFRNQANNYRRQEEQHLVAVEECQNLGRMLDSRVEGETDDDRWERCLYVYSLGVDEPDKNCSTYAAKAMEELKAAVATRTTFGLAHDTQKRLAEKFPELLALPGPNGYQVSLARCHTELGDWLISKGEANAGKNAYEQSLEIQQNPDVQVKLVDLFPMVPEYQDGLANDLERSSDLWEILSYPAEKRNALEQSRDRRLKMVEQFPAVPENQARLAACHDKLGRLLGELGENDLARIELERARGIRLKLIEKYPEVLEYQIDLAYGLHRLGNLPSDPSWIPDKRAAIEQALQSWQKLAEQFPEEPKYRNLLAGRYNNLGLLLRDIGQEAAARSALEQARDIRLKLVKEYPTVIEFQNDLAYSFHHLGNVLTSLGDSPAAKIAHEQARDNWQRLAEQQPAVTEYRIELGGSYSKLAAIAFATGMPEDCLKLYGQSISVLSTGFPPDDRNMQKRKYLRGSFVGRATAFASLDRHKEAVEDWNQVVSLVPADHETFRYRLDRIEARLQVGQEDVTLEELDDLLFLTKWGGEMAPRWTADQWYQFAHLYSHISGSASDPQTAYSDTAMELLKKAVDAGYNGPKNVANMEKDSYMDPLRARTDFQQLLKLMLEPSGVAPVIPPPPPEAVPIKPAP